MEKVRIIVLFIFVFYQFYPKIYFSFITILTPIVVSVLKLYLLYRILLINFLIQRTIITLYILIFLI